MGAVEGGRGAAGQRGEWVGCCEEEGGAEAVVGVDSGWVRHCCCRVSVGWGRKWGLGGGESGLQDFSATIITWASCVGMSMSRVTISTGRRWRFLCSYPGMRNRNS